MFKSARLKLTAWYLLIIMLISISFSLAMYTLLTDEFVRFESRQSLRQQHQLEQQFNFQEPGQHPQLSFRHDPELINETKNRIRLILLIINLTILGVSALSGYFLAGRTLRPIKQMVDEQNRFITDASHELRTPLTSLMTSIEVNLRNKKLSLKNAKDLLESNLYQAYSLRTLSDDLLALTQYQNNNGNIQFEEVNLVKIVDEALKAVNPLANKKQITIKNHTKDYSFEGDHKSLVDVVVILLDNAIKYSSNKTTIEIVSKVLDHSVSIIIKDQGIGISREDLPHIFDRFYRADKSRSKGVASGYGLGLSIAKKIIGEHSGEINVESEVDKGTQFSVQIPKKQSTISSALKL